MQRNSSCIVAFICCHTNHSYAIINMNKEAVISSNFCGKKFCLSLDHKCFNLLIEGKASGVLS